MFPLETYTNAIGGICFHSKHIPLELCWYMFRVETYTNIAFFQVFDICYIDLLNSVDWHASAAIIICIYERVYELPPSPGIPM